MSADPARAVHRPCPPRGGVLRPDAAVRRVHPAGGFLRHGGCWVAAGFRPAVGGGREPVRAGDGRCRGCRGAVDGAPGDDRRRPQAHRGLPQAGGLAARRAGRRAGATARPRARRPARRRPRLAGAGVPAAEAARHAAGAVCRRGVLGCWAGQPDVPVLVAVVPQPSPGHAPQRGAGHHAVRLVRPGPLHRRDLPWHVRRLRGRGRHAASRPVGDPGRGSRRPAADPRPAQPRVFGQAAGGPGTDPGAGGR